MNQTIIVQNTSLFKVALDELGDPLQWVNIAHVNGIKDPMITSLTQLLIPPASTVFSDGIGPQ